VLFNSLHFLIFFPVVVTIFFLLPQRARWVWLLAASCWFYAAFIPIYLLVLFFTIIIDYAAGILIEEARGAARTRWLVMSIAANLGVLAAFKYLDFLNENVAALFRLADWTYPVPTLGWILPIGLSFHTFQAMSYTIEVYRGHQPAERHFGLYALYVMFFPQLVAGPIERPQNLLPQFRVKHTFDYVRVTDGLKRMTWGMFKKVVIADGLASFVNRVYDVPQEHSGLTLLVATLFFAFQIYCDFSGYTDIALGAAEVMGFRLMENFRRPYFSKSISEFWTRWHISLSSWFRDYVYIPLGGNRVPLWRWYVNVAIVFGLSGLWHGAAWTFVVWGLLNGLYLIVGRAAAPLRERLAHATGLSRVPWLLRAAQVATTFALTCVAWVFFRARSMEDAFYVLGNMFRGAGDLMAVVAETGRVSLAITVAAVAVMELVHLMQRKERLRGVIAAQPVWVRWPLYYAAVLSIAVFGHFRRAQAFIYFQF
jgi:alginate O-acetyltransferase complex protein AlgI